MLHPGRKPSNVAYTRKCSHFTVYNMNPHTVYSRSYSHIDLGLRMSDFHAKTQSERASPRVCRESWGTVTYRELEQRIVVALQHWRATLAPLELKPRDVAGPLVFTHATCALRTVLIARGVRSHQSNAT